MKLPVEESDFIFCDFGFLIALTTLQNPRAARERTDRKELSLSSSNEERARVRSRNARHASRGNLEQVHEPKAFCMCGALACAGRASRRRQVAKPGVEREVHARFHTN